MGDRGKGDAYPLIRRYTSLPVLVDMLRHRRMTLVAPTRWADRNDMRFLEVYKQRKALKCLVALCFTATPEAFHHWNVFASGPAGVCIEFDKLRFVQEWADVVGLRQGPVRYKEIAELQKQRPTVEDLPFLKRIPYRDEVEYRLVYESGTAEDSTHDLDLDLGMIRRIYLSPWHPQELVRSTRDMLRSFDGSDHIGVWRTTVLDNPRWQRQAG